MLLDVRLHLSSWDIFLSSWSGLKDDFPFLVQTISAQCNESLSFCLNSPSSCLACCVQPNERHPRFSFINLKMCLPSAKKT